MKKFHWNQQKKEKLKAEREIPFEEIIIAIENGNLLDEIKHPSRTNQRIFVVLFKNYAYLVPYVQENEDSVFLKTIIPSRKATKKYLKEDNDKKI